MSAAVYGWNSDFASFNRTSSHKIHSALQDTYEDASEAELRSWTETIKILKRTIQALLDKDSRYKTGTIILEYQLPMESRRLDALLLLHQHVIVIELKGKLEPSTADVDQVRAYARDLLCYHRECDGRPVHAVLVPTRMWKRWQLEGVVSICGPDMLSVVICELDKEIPGIPALEPQLFLHADAYRPLPTLIRAARDLFIDGRPPRLWQSAANTDDAVSYIVQLISEASRTRTRRLVLLTGVPGAGKTLVGMRVAHQSGLDQLAWTKDVPAVFLSGNGPLVEVLQYVLREAGGGGKTFVRPIRDYIRYYNRNSDSEPREHVVVFDEAQRAFDLERTADAHKQTLDQSRSEPDHIIEFAERKSGWSVVVGLVGGGQEIHVGEEGGLAMWADAVRRCREPNRWTIHVPPSSSGIFQGLSVKESTTLSLDTTLRSHRATTLHSFVDSLLQRTLIPASQLRPLGDEIADSVHDLYITRDLGAAKRYLRERYQDDKNAIFGLIASSRDRDLEKIGVANDCASTKKVRYGPWYTGFNEDSDLNSCRQLDSCVTEFGAQGLELDGVLVAWGSDFILEEGSWVIDRARRYRSGGHARVRNAWQLRANAYRVLLTRGRDVHIVFVPGWGKLDETWRYLGECGFRLLKEGSTE